MALAPELSPPAVRWDLSALFDGIDDPRIASTWEGLYSRADDFASRYRGKINSPDLTPSLLAAALKEVEGIATDAAKPGNYGGLLFAADSSDPKIGAFYQSQMERSTELQVKLMFFELELQAAPDDVISALIEEPELESYRHYIKVSRQYTPHRLSEAEEVILEETANTGHRAWTRLFDELLSNYKFKFIDPASGEEKELSEQETVDLLREPDRATRLAAGDALSAGLVDMERTLVFLFNNLLQDKRVEDRLRKHPYAEHSRHLANELDKETVDLVIKLCKENYGAVERFYRLKKDILGLTELSHVDRYAPLFETSEKVDWDRARQIVLDSFGEFSQELRDRADDFFRESWIDAEPRKGKSGGAFCAYITPDTHPVILMTYLNKMDNVGTLAHELGHGVHASLSREQSYFNFHGTLPLAELASTFGEMLVFEKLVGQASVKDKLSLYAEKIESVFATVFRQAALFSFEQRAHYARRDQGELTAEQFGDIWHEEIQAMFGSSVTLGEQHRRWWSYISHFIQAPFYVYAYSFGELLVLSLYQKAKLEGPSFEAKYLEVLRLGGSRTPEELMAIVGVDLKSEEFWRGGFAAIDKLVGDFEELWREYKR